MSLNKESKIIHCLFKFPQQERQLETSKQQYATQWKKGEVRCIHWFWFLNKMVCFPFPSFRHNIIFQEESYCFNLIFAFQMFMLIFEKSYNFILNPL